MGRLSQRLLLDVARTVQKAVGLRPRWMDLEGRCAPVARDPLSALPRARKARVFALHESITRGEPCVFDVAPGVVSWIYPLEDRRIIHGALLGGEARLAAEEEIPDRNAAEELAAMGLAPRTADAFLRALPRRTRAEVANAAALLERTFLQISGWKPVLLEENRLRTQQQRQIAEAMEDQKKRGAATAYPFEKERALLAHIRAGDQTGARRVLNDMLGAMYMSSPRLALLRARAIEMMGHLTRAAVEDSAVMEPLIERNHRWMERLIKARDFEELCRVLTEALDDFIEGICLHGFNRSNTHVGRALDYIAAHYMKRLRLRDVARAAGISPYRLAHLVKENTGQSVIQIVQRVRIQNAVRLLERTDLSSAAIAYEVGYGDQSYFIRHFKRVMGVTPARYRRSRRGFPAGG